MAAEKLALENPQDILVKSLTNYGFMKVNVCNSKNLLPLAELMLDELSPLLEEKDDEKMPSLCAIPKLRHVLYPPKMSLRKRPPHISASWKVSMKLDASLSFRIYRNIIHSASKLLPNLWRLRFLKVSHICLHMTRELFTQLKKMHMQPSQK
jgi:hypothetical protein